MPAKIGDSVIVYLNFFISYFILIYFLLDRDLCSDPEIGKVENPCIWVQGDAI